MSSISSSGNAYFLVCQKSRGGRNKHPFYRVSTHEDANNLAEMFVGEHGQRWQFSMQKADELSLAERTLIEDKIGKLHKDHFSRVLNDLDPEDLLERFHDDAVRFHELLLGEQPGAGVIKVLEALSEVEDNGQGEAKRGRTGLTAKEKQRRRDLIAAWDTAHESGVSMKDFCNDGGHKLNDLEKCKNWQAQQRRRNGTGL